MSNRKQIKPEPAERSVFVHVGFTLNAFTQSIKAAGKKRTVRRLHRHEFVHHSLQLVLASHGACGLGTARNTINFY